MVKQGIFYLTVEDLRSGYQFYMYNKETLKTHHLESLVEDIRKNGLKVPLIVVPWENEHWIVIDGIHRLQALFWLFDSEHIRIPIKCSLPTHSPIIYPKEVKGVRL